MKLKFGLMTLSLIPVIILLSSFIPDKPSGERVQEDLPSISNNIDISFVGDIMLASNVDVKLKFAGSHYPFEKVRPLLSVSDISMGNLETSASVGGIPQIKQFTFRSDPKYLEGVKWSGLDILSTANNHILDYGTSALQDTLFNLDSYKLQHVGSGKNISEALKPVIFSKGGKSIAFFAASHVIPNSSWSASSSNPGVASAYDPTLLFQKIKESSSSNYLTVVYMHWGNEKDTVPDETQKRLAHQLIDNGADIVVGTHSHTVQGFEYYKGKLIAYSLGNFVFTDYRKDSMILNIDIDDNKMIKARIIPCEIRDFRPEPLNGMVEKEEFYKMLQDRSVNVKIRKGQLIWES